MFYNSIFDNVYDFVYVLVMFTLVFILLVLLLIVSFIYMVEKNKMQNKYLKEQSDDVKAKILEYQQIMPNIFKVLGGKHNEKE